MEQNEQDIIRSLYQDVPELDFQHFLAVVERTGLKPLSSPRQIYLVGRKQKVGRERYETVYTVQTGIDGLRVVAARTGVHAGTDDVEYQGKFSLNSNVDAPLMARITVWKMVKGVRVPFSASVRWAEFYPGKSFIWDAKPYHMLGKCCEALGLRRGFPQDLSGLYIPEEFDQTDVGKDLAEVTADKPVGAAQQLRSIGKADPELGFDGVFIAVCEAADELGHDHPVDISSIALADDAVLEQAVALLENPGHRERIIESMKPWDDDPIPEPEQGSLT